MAREESREPWHQIFLEWIWELIKTLVVVFLLVYLIRSFIVQPFIIQGASMEPNFHSSDYLLVERFSRISRDFRRGDVVVFDSEGGRGHGDDFIKRIIGLPNETVTITNGQVFISRAAESRSFKLLEPYLKTGSQTLTERGERQEVTLGSEDYFVLGDNREASRDSRIFGSIKRQEIVGKAWLVTFPISDFGLVSPPAYSEVISG